MNNLEIKININKLLSQSGSLLRTIDKKTLTSIIKAFSEYVSRLYIRLIEEAIYSGRYKGEWEPVDDEKYREYLGVTPTVDIIELMKESIEVRKIGYYFTIRFNPRYKYPGSKLSLVKVLRAIDSGTSKFHARPIFKRILREINSCIFDLWKGFLKQKGVL